MKFRPKQTRQFVGTGLKAPPPHLAPTAPVADAYRGETLPRFRRDPEADVLPVNAHVVGGAARLAPDLTAGERERQTRLSTVCTVAADDVELRPARLAGHAPTPRPATHTRRYSAGTTQKVRDALASLGRGSVSEIAAAAGVTRDAVWNALGSLADRGDARRTDEVRRLAVNGRRVAVWTLATAHAPAAQPKPEVHAA